MSARAFLSALVFTLGAACLPHAHPGPREAEWNKVAEAADDDLPETQIKLLTGIQEAAYAAGAWPEGAKAQMLRIMLQAEHEDDVGHTIRALEAEIPAAPESARPLLRLLRAEALAGYGFENFDDLLERAAVGGREDGDFETWDFTTWAAATDRAFQEVLAATEPMQKVPVGDLAPLLRAGEVGDAIRPTLFDFIAHSANAFYAAEVAHLLAFGEYEDAPPPDPFVIRTDSPAFATAAAFLAWQLPESSAASPRLRALRLYQDLLAFHRSDADRSAFLHCDLERLRFAGYAAVGARKSERRDAAFRAFIEEHDEHPVSADARAALARRLLEREERKEAHAVALAGATAFPEHPYGKECRGIVAAIEAKQLGLDTETHWTPAGAELTVSHTNLNHIWFRAYPAKWSPKEALESDPTPKSDEQQAKLLREKPVLAWDAPVPDDGDFKPRVTELPAPKDLEPGFYLIVASGSADFSAKVTPVLIQPVHITRHALVVRRDGDRVGGLVTDAVSGAPLPGVEVVRWQKRKLLPGIASTKTRSDADGWFSFPSRKDDEEVMVTAGKGADLAVARANFYLGGDDDDDDGKRVVLFTDRRIYRPGQTIHFKGVWCEAKWREGVYRTLEGKKVSVRMSDPKGNEVATQELVSNEWGSFSGTFTAPAGGLLGGYNIAVSGLYPAYFSIEEYKRPKFTATIEPPDGQAALGDEVRAVLRATAFTGAAVDGAKVKWRITRTVEWPERARGAGSNQAEIARGTAVTGPDGTLPLVFTATPDDDADPADAPVFQYQIEATVTDAAGESHDADLTITIGYTGFCAEVYAAGWQTTDQPVDFTLETRRHGEGPPCAVAGTLTIHRLKEPANCPRGNRVNRYNWRSLDDDPTDIRRWPLGEQTASMPAETNKDGEGEVVATVPAGVYRAVFTAKDAKGREVKATHDFQVLDLASERFPTHRPFVATAPERKLQPGGPFTVLWGSGHAEARACVEFFKDGKLLKREWSAPGRTQQVFTIATDESMRGGITARVTQTTLNRMFEKEIRADIPWSNKELKVRWEHFTDKLAPGARETWTAVVTGPDGSPAPVEMVAALYDASLDELHHTYWNSRYAMTSQLRYDDGLSPGTFASIANSFDTLLNPEGREDDFDLEQPYRDWFEEREDYGDYAGGINPLLIRSLGQSDDVSMISSFGMAGLPNSVAGVFGSGGTVALSGVMTAGLRSGDGAISRSSIDAILNRSANSIAAVDAPPAAVPQPPRRNLQETAFFYPHLVSDERGEVRIAFTMPEALTTWRFFGIAHDRELRSGFLDGETVTAKDLMVQPNPPRFLREGDTLIFTVRVTNQSDREQSGTASLTLTDAATLRDATAALGIAAPEQSWTLPAKQSRALSWRLAVPDGTGFLNYRATATAGDLTDGEEGWLPVLPRRVVRTESVNLPVRGAGSREFVLEKLAASGGSPTLEHRALTIETVANPAWYALLSLPYLMEFPHECAEQVFHRYYANALAGHLVASRPELRTLLEQWRQTKALTSPLAAHPDIAGITLEETPWLATAANQAESRRRLAELFDPNRLDPALTATLEKVRAMQLGDGMWPWFPGGPGNEHITCTIATGFARLRAAGVPTDITPALKAMEALDAEIDTRHREIIRRSLEAKADPATVNWVDPFLAAYLYTRTLFLQDREVAREHRGAFRFFVENANRHWAKLDSRMSRAHLALALHRCLDDKNKTPLAITRSLREHAKVSPDGGMEWKDAESGWHWWQAPLETQALMIEAFREIERDDQAVEDCRVWLIARKQTTDWGTTTATADAVHALLTGGRDWLQPAAPLRIALAGVPQTPSAPEPGTGAQELRVAGPAIQPDMARITLTKSGPGVAWAAAHWQYAEELSRVAAHDTPGLKLETGWFVRQPDRSLAPLTSPLKPGDELVTRLVIRTDRPMEFVHLKVPRASGTEPMTTLSGYRWQGRIGYYETTRDAASHYFIESLPAGAHVIETGERVQHAGVYQTGAAEIRCMYAPAFAAHGASREVVVDET